MTTDDLRTRAREAAAILYADPVKDSAAVYTRHALRYYQRGAYEAGFLAHAAQQPSRDAIRDELAHWPIGYGYESASVSIDDAGDMADAVLALLNGDKS